MEDPEVLFGTFTEPPLAYPRLTASGLRDVQYRQSPTNECYPPNMDVDVVRAEL